MHSQCPNRIESIPTAALMIRLSILCMWPSHLTCLRIFSMRISAIDGSPALQRISTFVILFFLDTFIRCVHCDHHIASMELLHLTLIHSPRFQHHTAGKKGQQLHRLCTWLTLTHTGFSIACPVVFQKQHLHFPSCIWVHCLGYNSNVRDQELPRYLKSQHCNKASWLLIVMFVGSGAK